MIKTITLTEDTYVIGDIHGNLGSLRGAMLYRRGGDRKHTNNTESEVKGRDSTV